MDKSANEKSRKIYSTFSYFTKQNRVDIILAILGFFLGRAQIFGVLSPLATASLTPVFFEGSRFYLYAIFTTAGLLTKFNITYTLKYILVVFIMWFLNVCFSHRLAQLSDFIKSGVVGALMFVSGILLVVIRGISLYAVLICLLEAVLTFSMSFVLSKSRQSIIERTKALSGEELICIAFFAGGIIIGAADIWIGWLSLRYFFCGLVILPIVQKVDGAAGAATGVLLGLMMNAAGFESSEYAICLASAALAAGFLKRFGKYALALGFTAVMPITALYFGTYKLELLVSFALVSITYIILPSERFLSGITEILSPVAVNPETYYSRVKYIAAEKLKSFSEAFSNLSRAYNEMYEKRTSFKKAEVNSLLDDVVARSCKGCPKRKYCWEDKFYDTYQIVYGLLKMCDTNSEPDVKSEENLMNRFETQCINSWEFYLNLNHFNELYKNELKWKNLINETRIMASEQLMTISKLIKNLSLEMEFSGKFSWELEKQIKIDLLKNKIEVENVIILQDKNGKYEIEISHKSCGYKKECSQDIIPVINSLLGRKMKKAASECIIERNIDMSICRMRLIEEQKMSVSCGVARETAGESNISGDSYSHMEHKNGKVTLVLSDGMGTGSRAGEESTSAVELFEDFTASGFEREMSVKLINSALLLKSNYGISGETFSTLDICDIDLHTGKAEFIKVGASSSFLISGDNIETLRSYSLPVGILETVEPEITSRRVKHGDIIIMMTDGVLDSYVTEGTKENWVVNAISRFKNVNPQNIADSLLDEAKKNYKDGIKDDMTILVARIWEKI